MLISHLMWCVMWCYLIKNFFHNKNNIKLFKRKNTMAEKLWQNMFYLKTIWSLKDLKRQKKIQEFPICGNVFTDFHGSKYFFSVDFGMYHWHSHRIFIPDSFLENRIWICSFTWTALFGNLHFCPKLLCFNFSIILYIFVC